MSERTGLAEGIPLVVGSGDHQSAAGGLGNVTEGVASIVLGTAGVVVAQSNKPIRDPHRKAHVIGSALGRWEIEGHSNAAGSSFKWVRGTFGELEMTTQVHTGENCYDLLTKQAEASPPGSQGWCSSRGSPAPPARTTTPTHGVPSSA